MAKISGLVAPGKIQYKIAVEPALNALASLYMVHLTHDYSGLAQWAIDTENSLNRKQMQNNKMVFEGLFDFIELDQSWGSFEEFLSDLEEIDSQVLVDRIIDKSTREREGEYAEDPSLSMPSHAELLADRELFITHKQRMSSHKPKDAKFLSKVHDLLNAPNELKNLLVAHLSEMWNTHLKGEWKRISPLLQESVRALRNVDLTEMSPKEAIRTIIGRDLIKSGYFEDVADLEQIVFIPSAHIGPYALFFFSKGITKVLFGAQQSERFEEGTTALSRSDLLVRLTALADDSRLQILELLTENKQLYAQEIADILQLSQSSISRHLIQLSATGYLNERRDKKGKCYTVNSERIEDTARLLEHHFVS